MKEKIADNLVNGLSKTFDVGFDIGNVSAGVAKGYFDLKRFQLIVGYAHSVLMVLICIGTLIFITRYYLKATKRGCLAEREEKLQQIANEREAFAANMSNEIKRAAKDEVKELNKKLRQETECTFNQMLHQNREAWKKVMGDIKKTH